MKKIVLIYFLLFAILGIHKAQVIEIFKDEDLLMIIRNNRSILKINEKISPLGKNMAITYLDSIIDTVDYVRNSVPISMNLEKLILSYTSYSYNTNESQFQSIDICTGEKISFEPLYNKCYKFYSDLLITDTIINNIPVIRFYDHTERKVRKSIAIKNLIKNQTISEIFVSNSKSMLLIKTGQMDDEGTGYINCHYYTLNINNNDLNEISIQQKQFLKNFSNTEEIIGYQDIYGSNFFCKNGYYMDDEFQFKSPILTRLIYSYDLAGYNVQNNTISSFYYFSRTDEHVGYGFSEVIIPLRITIETEKALYNIYNDKPVDKAELKNMNKYDLDILRNMVFAKHNYKFDLEFYQAYFNTFEFYSSEAMRNSRTKDVGKLLTPADKQNLEAIKKELKKFEN
jgi:hypothetical protein